MHIITGIWYKQQEHKQLPPLVLSRDIRRWAPSAVSHCLKVCSETALKLSCVHKIFLSHRPCTRQGTGVQVDHLWSLISTRPDLLMYWTSVSSLTSLQSQEFKKAENCQGFFCIKKDFCTFAAASLVVHFSKSSLAWKGLLNSEREAKPTVIGMTDGSTCWHKDHDFCLFHFQIRKKKKLPVGRERLLHYPLHYFLFHLFPHIKIT